MSYDPESTVARPLLALTSTSPSYAPHRRHWLRRRLGPLALIAAGALALLALAAVLAPTVGLPLPASVKEYYQYQRPLPPAGNAPPPPGGQPAHPHAPPPAHPDGHAPLDGPPSSSPSSPDDVEDAIAALYAAQPRTLAAARARYALKTGRPPPTGYDQFFAFARERQCLVDAYDGVHADFLPFWRAERARAQRGWFRESVRRVEELLKTESRGLTAIRVQGGEAHLPGYQGTYFDGAWETTINKFASALPPLTVLINGRDEPRVVFDTLPLFEGDPSQIPSLTAPHDHTPFALAPPSTRAFFAPLPGCGGERRVDEVPFLLSASSAEFTTDLVPVLSMARVAGLGDRAPAPGSGSFSSSSSDSNPTFNSSAGAVGGGGEGDAEGERGHTCFADVLVPGEFYYRTSWWAGQFAYPDHVPWADKKEVLYWRGKSNGGHIRGTNYRSFPRFRLLDLAARPESVAKGLFDVRMTAWHEGHCTDGCDAEPIKAAYNITEDAAPREEAYGFKYLLDVDGNTFSGRYLGLLRSGGLVFKSTSFTEFFTPWLVPFEHFIPVRPDLADLPAKIEWARANDEEAHRIQQSGRAFAERVLTDAQNDCYWFAVLLEWGALWGE
ncbi:glycosyl transferase family 90-domain-containing protein [Mycena rosella]|uniref:Glycosyl transferase family 90-domain-containing protein n=1 Tax=Mycena rosella TaxID=1033263 RepID=A0AAD7CVK1_MYCRO|nr:glycosyl transferase family 90-domain-containing protein [Mycena rosella]